MIRFTCSGHKNILGTHRNTLEFIKSKELTLQGDCIIGVESDFLAQDLKKLKGCIEITLNAGGIIDSFAAEINPDFDDDKEIVFRKSEFNSKRTLGFNASKASKDISREIIKYMKNPNSRLEVKICEKH